MARKRKKARSSRAQLILIALLLAGIVAWAIAPRGHKQIATQGAPAASPAASPATSPAATPEASAQATAEPSANPTQTPTINPHGPQLAIIIDDCGQWLSTERAYIALPIRLTLAVMPHVRYSTLIAKEANDAGKGVMLHLPMEPLSGQISGPGEITTAMTDTQIDSQTRDDLDQVPLARGVNNHEGSAASADARVMKDVMAVVKERGLFFIDSRTNAKTVAAAQATDDGVPNASRDVFLDNVATLENSEAMLRLAAEIAKTRGSAIAIGHPKPTTLRALGALYPELESQGVQFVLVSNLVR